MSLLKRIDAAGKSAANQSPGDPKKDKEPTRLAQLQAKQVPGSSNTSQAGSYFDLKTRVARKLLAELDPSMDVTRTEEVRRTIQGLFEQILAEENIVLSRPERARLFEQIAAEIIGYGPLQPLLEDDTITALMVNGPKSIYIERRGYIHRVPVTFENNDHVMHIIDRIVSPSSRRVDESQLYQSATLLNGYSAAFLIPPASLVGPVIYVKKVLFENHQPFFAPCRDYREAVSGTVPEFLELRSGYELLSEITRSDKNLMIISETGTGKSTLINDLLRIRGIDGIAVRLHNALESNCISNHILDVEAVLPSVDDKGGKSRRDLWQTALRLRPQLIVYEVENDDPLVILESLLTINTWSSISGRSPLQGLENFAYRLYESDSSLSLQELRSYIAGAIDYVIFIKEFIGRRCIASCDKLFYDRDKDEFNLVSQLEAVEIEIKTVRAESKKPKANSSSFFQRFFHKAAKDLDTSTIPSSTSNPINSEPTLAAHDSLESLDSLDTLLGQPLIDHLLLTGDVVLSSRSGHLKLEGINNLKQDNYSQLMGSGIFARDGSLLPYASLSTSHPSISRIEILTSALGSLERNICICKVPGDFPKLTDLIKNYSIELQDEVVDVIKKGGNVLVSGLPDSGKTSLLNCILESILSLRHVTTLEYVPELRIKRQGTTTRLVQPAFNQSGFSQKLTPRIMLKTAPDHLVIDGDFILPYQELLECLKTISVITTITGRSAIHALELSVLRLCAETGVDAHQARSMIANTFDMILHVARIDDGTLQVTEIVHTKKHKNLEKIARNELHAVSVLRPNQAVQNPSATRNHISIGEDSGNSLASQPAADLKLTGHWNENLFRVLEQSRQIISERKSNMLAMSEIQKIVSEHIIPADTDEFYQMVEFVHFAGSLSEKLFEFFADSSTVNLLLEVGEQPSFSIKNNQGEYRNGSLTETEAREITKQLNLVLGNRTNSFIGGPAVGRVELVPWLDIFWVFQPLTPVKAIWMLQKRPVRALDLSTIRDYFEIEQATLGKLKAAVTNQLNIVVMGTSCNLTELVAESLVNSDASSAHFGIVCDFGKIFTVNDPVFSVDAMEFGNLDFGLFGTAVSNLVDSPDIDTLVIAAYPGTLAQLIAKSKQKRIIASTIVSSTETLMATGEAHHLEKNSPWLATLLAQFDVVVRVINSSSRNPRIILV